MTPPPDWIELVVDARDGRASAQAALLERFEPLVRATAARLIDRNDVDDVVQESFAAALRTLGSLRTPEAFPSWLRLIVRKEASRLRASSSALIVGDTDLVDAPDSDPVVAVQHRELAEVVRVALRSAREADRRLIELRYLAGWTNAELAELLGISDGAVRKRLHDARRRLRPHLEHLTPKEIPVTDSRAFLDTIHDAATVVIPPGPDLRRPDGAPTVTGLRIIDAAAPIRRGGTVEMVGPGGTGHLVLALELLHRLGRTEHDVACVAVGAKGAAIGSQPDLGHIVTEMGIPGPNAAVLWSDATEAGRAFDAGTRLAAGLAGEGLDVVLVVDGATLDSVDAAALRAAAGMTDEGAVTVVAVRTLDRHADRPSPLGLDTTLVFSIEQFALGIFPALDPLRSTSIFERSAIVEQALAQLAAAAEIRSWFAQPMYVAEDYTGEAGTWAEPTAADADLARLLG